MYVESQGQMQEILGVLQRRKWQIILPTVFAFAIGCSLAVLIPKKYRVMGKFELRHTRVEKDVSRRNPQGGALAQEVDNVENHLESGALIERVIKELGWEDFAQLDRKEQSDYTKRVRSSINISVKRKEKASGSTFIEISYSDIRAKRAEQFLNAHVKAWVKDIIDWDIGQLEGERDLLQNDLRDAKRLYSEALNERNRIQNEMGLLYLPNGRMEGNRNEDPVVLQLTKLMQDRDEVEIELAALEAEIAYLQEEFDKAPDEVLFERTELGSSTEVQVAKLEQEIAILKLSQEGLLPRHSRFQTVQDQIDVKEDQIDVVRNLGREDLTTQRFVPNEEKARMAGQLKQKLADGRTMRGTLEAYEARQRELTDIQTQKRELQRQHDEIELDVEVRREQLKEAQNEVNLKQAAIKGLERANKNPLKWHDRPIAEAAEPEPNVFLIAIAALLAGLVAGLGSSVVMEFTKNSFRNVSDVTGIMTLPVLGVINTITTRRERRQARFKTILISSSSSIMIAVLAWFTYTFETDRDTLPSGVVQAIEEMQRSFY